MWLYLGAPQIGWTAQSRVQDGRQRDSHPRQRFFRDASGRQYDVTEMMPRQTTVASSYETCIRKCGMELSSKIISIVRLQKIAQNFSNLKMIAIVT